MIGWLGRRIGGAIANYLQNPSKSYVHIAGVADADLRAVLRPGDVLLVDGDSRVSAAIKFLTLSNWSHAALFVGPSHEGGELVEADLKAGVRLVELSSFAGLNMRVCRPVGLTEADLAQVIEYAISSIGRTYDLRNIFDLARYLLPEPPVPRRWRRRMLALGSGDPTRAICSTLIAEAFQKIRYPILPAVEPGRDEAVAAEIYHIRHHSLFTPRDFDLSPFFCIIKPTLERGFDYRSVNWDDLPNQRVESRES